MSVGGFDVSHVTLYFSPTFHTVLELGYSTGGSYTSLFPSPAGKAFTKDIMEKRAKKSVKKKEVLVNCIMKEIRWTSR